MFCSKMLPTWCWTAAVASGFLGGSPVFGVDDPSRVGIFRVGQSSGIEGWNPLCHPLDGLVFGVASMAGWPELGGQTDRHAKGSMSK